MQEQVEQDNKATDTTLKKQEEASTPTTDADAKEDKSVQPVEVDTTPPPWMMEENEPNFAGISQRDVKYWVYHPYESNLWRVHVEKGVLPEFLNGKYTSKVAALNDVKFYLEHRQKPLNTSRNRRSKKSGQNSKQYVEKSD